MFDIIKFTKQEWKQLKTEGFNTIGCICLIPISFLSLILFSWYNLTHPNDLEKLD